MTDTYLHCIFVISAVFISIPKQLELEHQVNKQTAVKCNFQNRGAFFITFTHVILTVKLRPGTVFHFSVITERISSPFQM